MPGPGAWRPLNKKGVPDGVPGPLDLCWPGDLGQLAYRTRTNQNHLDACLHGCHSRLHVAFDTTHWTEAPNPHLYPHLSSFHWVRTRGEGVGAIGTRPPFGPSALPPPAEEQLGSVIE
jgi:hypothetical protein